MVWREKIRSRIKVVHKDNLTGLSGIRRIHTIPNARVKEPCGVEMRLDENIDKSDLSVLWAIWRAVGSLKRVHKGSLWVVIRWDDHQKGGCGKQERKNAECMWVS